MNHDDEIIVQHEGVKRKLKFPLSLCGDTKVMRRFAEEILHELDANGRDTYGWVCYIDVRVREKDKHTGTNVPVKEWHE